MKAALLLCAVAFSVASCADWQGARDIDTVPPSESYLDGPGLFSGKEGGFTIYEHVWSGSAPGEPKPPE